MENLFLLYIQYDQYEKQKYIAIPCNTNEKFELNSTIILCVHPRTKYLTRHQTLNVGFS